MLAAEGKGRGGGGARAGQGHKGCWHALGEWETSSRLAAPESASVMSLGTSSSPSFFSSLSRPRFLESCNRSHSVGEGGGTQGSAGNGERARGGGKNARDSRPKSGQRHWWEHESSDAAHQPQRNNSLQGSRYGAAGMRSRPAPKHNERGDGCWGGMRL